MNNNIRIFIYLSPDMEEDIINGIIDHNTLYKLLSSFINFAEIFKLSCFVFLPNNLKSWKSFPKIRILLDKIESSTQSNIIFFSKIPNCYKHKELREELVTENGIINSLINNRLPLLFTNSNKKEYIKDVCNSCKKIHTMCYITKTLYIGNINSINNNFRAVIEDYCKISLDKWYINLANLDELKIKQFLIIYAKLKNISEELLPKIQSIKITEEFIKLLKKERKKEIENIFSSILRATLYPPSNDKNKHLYSIDYHRNKPFNINKFKIFRLDIVSWTETGNKDSGLKRILFAENENNKKIFFHYDFAHAELSEKIIIKKLENI